jgi:hypothetical protein
MDTRTTFDSFPTINGAMNTDELITAYAVHESRLDPEAGRLLVAEDVLIAELVIGGIDLTAAEGHSPAIERVTGFWLEDVWFDYDEAKEAEEAAEAAAILETDRADFRAYLSDLRRYSLRTL